MYPLYWQETSSKKDSLYGNKQTMGKVEYALVIIETREKNKKGEEFPYIYCTRLFREDLRKHEFDYEFKRTSGSLNVYSRNKYK